MNITANYSNEQSVDTAMSSDVLEIAATIVVDFHTISQA